jgi:crotonobetainyl-CoA:carnitine CoA-transferase CaiB-like acyl-CoA transferase
VQDKGMFSGLKVLELASVLAGPSVGQFFAELGAEVIKVENLTTGGDVTRTWRLAGEEATDVTAYFSSVNMGKKSMAVNLTTAEGLGLVKQLAQNSDVVIVSFKPGDAERLGVDYAHLSAENPRLIYGQITGYGPENPRVGYDALVQAEAGFMLLNGTPDSPPVKMPVALMDLLAGHQLKEGLLLALLTRERTGMGRKVEVSLIQAGVASLANQATAWLVAGQMPRAMGSAHPSIAPYGDLFQTASGHWVMLAVGNDKQFGALCHILEHPEWSSDSRFASNPQRVVHREQLKVLLAGAIRKSPTQALLESLQIKHVPAGRIHTMQEVFEMPEAQALVVTAGEALGLRTFVAQGIPTGSALLPPPGLSAHADEILMGAGYTAAHIHRLRASGVIH